MWYYWSIYFLRIDLSYSDKIIQCLMSLLSNVMINGFSYTFQKFGEIWTQKMYENKFLKLPICKVHAITLENIQIESHFDAFQNWCCLNIFLCKFAHFCPYIHLFSCLATNFIEMKNFFKKKWYRHSSISNHL